MFKNNIVRFRRNEIIFLVEIRKLFLMFWCFVFIRKMKYIKKRKYCFKEFM